MRLKCNVASRQSFFERCGGRSSSATMLCVFGGFGSPGQLAENSGAVRKPREFPRQPTTDGTTEPVHKGRNGTSNGAQSNPSVSKTKRDGRVGKRIRVDETICGEERRFCCSNNARRQNTCESIPITRNGTGRRNPDILIYTCLTQRPARKLALPLLTHR